MSLRLSLSLVLLAFGLGASPAAAQWSDDPAQNLTVAGRASGQAQPKLVPTADGGFYVSWLGGGGDGYDVYLQRLDADGDALWEPDGIRVADRDLSSTEDYGLAVDADDNALLAFRFPDAGGTIQAVANVVSPDGELRWDAPGVFASDDASAAAAPRIAATSGGSAVVAWTSFTSGGIVLQKLDAEGAPLWGAGVSLVLPSGVFFLADLHADPAGNPIVSGSAQLSNFDRRLWTQKLSASDGAPLWGATPVEVFDGSDGALQFGYFPPFVPDGEGGAVFAWYQVGGASEARVRVQHVLADGSTAFPQNGVDAATGTDRERSAPSAAYDAATDDIYVVWPEDQQVGSTRTFGVSAQRIDDVGVRRWGEAGRTLVPLGDMPASQVSALTMPDGAVFAWSLGTAPSPMRIEAARLGAESDFVWPGEIVPLKTAPTAHSRMRGALSAWGYAAYAWTDGDSPAVVKAQDVAPGGDLGLVRPPAATFERAALTNPVARGATTSTATITLSNAAPEGEGTLTFAASAAAPTALLVDFEDGANPYGLTLGIPEAETIETTGGNPGRWLRNDVLDTAIPALYITEPPFTGDYVAQHVRSITLDAQTVSAPSGVGGRPFSLRLIRHNGEPDNVEAHDYVYFTGDLVPQPGAGWSSYTYPIPSDFGGELPEGWTGGYYGDLENLPPGVVWQDILREVDEVQVMWGHPAFFYLLQPFDIGVDNVQIDYDEADPEVLTVAPRSGTIPAGASEELTLTVDAAGLETGSYAFEVRIETNAPDRPVVVVEVTVEVTGGLATDDGSAPSAVALAPTYPNPFAQTSTVTFDVPTASPVLLEVFDVTGRRVAELADRAFEAGRHSVVWDAGSLPSGTYIIRLRSGDTVATRRAVILK